VKPEKPMGNQRPLVSSLRAWALAKMLAGLLGIYLLWPSGLMATWAKMHETTNTVHPVGTQWLINMGRLLPDHLANWLLSIPFVVVAIGLLELVANRPFWQLATSWEGMKKTTHDWLVFLILCLAFAGIILATYLCLRRAGAGGW
jgi:hypothetical protein